MRATILDQPTRPWLLHTLVHDGPVEAILADLLGREAASPSGTGPLHQLLDTVDGMPDAATGWRDDDRVALLLAHRRAPRWQTLAYSAYPGWSVADLTRFQTVRTGGLPWPAPEDEA